MGGGESRVSVHDLIRNLRYEADASEKGVDFMDDPELADETRENIALIREAADTLEQQNTAIGAYVSALRSGEPESDQMRELLKPIDFGWGTVTTKGEHDG